MRPSVALQRHRQAVRTLTTRYRLQNPRIFGSVLRGTDTEQSDLDVLVDAPRGTTYIELCGLQLALEDLLGVRVDVLTPNALGDRFREAVLAEAQLV